MTYRNKHKDLVIYQLLDFVAAMIAWMVFFIYRKQLELIDFAWRDAFQDRNIYLGLIAIPLFWLLLYYLFDKYQDVYRLSRVSTLFRTASISFIGVIVLLFSVLRDDLVLQHIDYFESFLRLFCLHFLVTASFRMVWLSYTASQLKAGRVKYQTLLVGQSSEVSKFLIELSHQTGGHRYHFLGRIGVTPQDESYALGMEDMAVLGYIDDLPDVIRNEEVEEAILLMQLGDTGVMQSAIQSLLQDHGSLAVSVSPEMSDIILGHVQMSQIDGVPLIEVRRELMPRWQFLMKRIIDLAGSMIGLAILSPVMLYSALRIKASSEGSIIFSQERIGRYGRPFHMYKFRSMQLDAEADGPELAQVEDPRITPWGATMRKWRLDEIPQFWNVLKGDMSLVGPRPERQYYIDQIAARAPYHHKLLQVQPGMTSWGQVKYGYASDVDQMLQRLKYDILYVENMSLLLDLKIMIYTALVLLQGKGK